MQPTNLALDLTEQGYLPDSVIRLGMRRLIKQRLNEIHADDTEQMATLQTSFIQSTLNAVIAEVPEKANEQHYEVPAEFFQTALGPHLKYSSCYWEDGCNDLGSAEVAALKTTTERAQLGNHMNILELGCGWGSLTLYMAQEFPESQITAVSNSASQKEFILQIAKQSDLTNINVITCDMNEFHTDQEFDRVVSIEMFEHMRNHAKLYAQIHDWLLPGGKFFMHIFVHRDVPYLFEEKDASDWMSRHFFSGGMMPSDDFPLFFQDKLKIQQRWRWEGTHYAKTAKAWLDNMDDNKDAIWPMLENTYGKDNAQQWFMRWRVFFMACEELFAYRNGQEWWVSHYLFERPMAD